jgi:hypothetical protein
MGTVRILLCPPRSTNTQRTVALLDASALERRELGPAQGAGFVEPHSGQLRSCLKAQSGCMS